MTETSGSWARGVEAPLPADAASTSQFVNLDSVSCAAAGDCTAVGSYADKSPNDNGEGLLLTETSGAWSTGVEAQLPVNATTDNQSAEAVSVSCASAGNCIAVGSYLVSGPTTAHGLILSETSGVWSQGVEPPRPANATTQTADLRSVSCRSSGNCAAVGFYQESAGDEGLLLDETSGAWSASEAALPGNANASSQSAELFDVSCSAAGDCGAIGSYKAGTLEEGVLVSEAGGTWAGGVEAPLPANAITYAPGPLYSLNSISCASAGNCSAVGTYFDNNAVGQAVLLTETSGAWGPGVEATMPANAETSSGEFAAPVSISCPVAGDCEAVGSYNKSASVGESMSITESSGNWATAVETSLPSNSGGNPEAHLDAVSCASVGHCAGVGVYGTVATGTEGMLLDAPAPAAPAPTWTLTVSKTGGGTGTVTSSPSGIACGSTCGATYAAGTRITLTATAQTGSVFTGWSGAGCSGTASCQVTLNADTTVTAEFDPLVPEPPPPAVHCVVPKLTGKTLTAARRALKSAHCSLGRVKKAYSARVKAGRVIKQGSAPRRRLSKGARVSVTVSRGKRR